jgi:hypothetical protein
MAYRFVPQFSPSNNPQGIDFGHVDTDIMFENLLNKFEYGNMELPDVYLDETNRRLSYNLRTIFGRLANELVIEGKNDKAIEALDFAMEKMPVEKFGYNYFIFGIIDSYYKAGAKEKARDIIWDFADQLDAELNFYSSFDRKDKRAAANEWRTNLQFYQMLLQNVQVYDDKDSVQSLYQRYNNAAAPFGNAQG